MAIYLFLDRTLHQNKLDKTKNIALSHHCCVGKAHFLTKKGKWKWTERARRSSHRWLIYFAAAG